MFQDPVRQCLESHGIPEKEIESALKRIEDITNSVLKTFDDFKKFRKNNTVTATRLKSTESDQRKIRSMRNSLKNLCKYSGYQADAARLIEKINRRENAFNEAKECWRRRTEIKLRLFLGQNINATIKAKYINDIIVCLVESLTHLIWFDEKWIGLKKSQAFVLIAGFLNEHASEKLPGTYLNHQESPPHELIRSRYNKNKKKKASIPHLS